MRKFLLLVLFVVVLSSCGRRENPAIVNIQNVSPSGDVGLISGDQVKFIVTARVDGMTKPSALALIVQSNGATLGVVEPVLVENGKNVTMELEMKVPDGSSLEVIAPLYENGSKETEVMDTRVFKIIGKRS